MAVRRSTYTIGLDAGKWDVIVRIFAGDISAAVGRGDHDRLTELAWR